MSEIFSKAVALSDSQLREFCHKNNLEFNLVTLEQINSAEKRRPKFSFIFTGDTKNEYNNGYDHHWLFSYGNILFDSYGFEKEYKLPGNWTFVKTHPSRLQSYNSEVCGEYCCAFYWFIRNVTPDYANLGVHFANYFELTTNTRSNDEKILEFYESHS